MEEKRLKVVLVDYLERKSTDYAIMINGEWGSGKTYFWKEIFIPLLEKEREELLQGFQPIYVSVYGARNIDDIASQILLYSTFKNSSSYSDTVKPFVELGKKIFKLGTGVVVPFTFSPTSVLLTYLAIKRKNNKSYIICVDDLERANPECIHEILGFFSKLIEQFGIKVVFLSNEKELMDIDNDKYGRQKEKLIRYTYEFKNDISNSINAFFSLDPTLNKSQLVSYVDFISDLLLNAEERNLRVVKRSLIHCAEVLNSFNKIENQVEVKVEDILRYTLSVSCELAKTSNKLDLIKEWTSSGYYYDLKQDINADNNLLKFLATFQFKENTSHFTSPEIFSLVTTGDFEEEKFINHIIEKFSYGEKQKLRFLLEEPDRLGDEEILHVARQCLSTVSNGKVNDVNSHLNIAHKLIDYINTKIIDLTYEELENAFSVGLNKHIADGTLLLRGFRERGMPPVRNAIRSNIYNSIEAKVLEAEAKTYTKIEASKALQLPTIIRTNNSDLLFDYFRSTEVNIFEYIKEEDLYSALLDSENKTKNNFIYSLQIRYNAQSMQDYKKLEIAHLNNLANSIKDYLKKVSVNKQSHYLLSLCVDEINTIDRVVLQSNKTMSANENF